MRTSWFFADVETTGVGPQDKVVEVAWMLLDDETRLVSQGCSTINPERPIPAESTAIHGIGDEDVLHSPTLDEYFSGLELDLGGSVFCAYNSPFDYRFLSKYLWEGTPQMDVLRLARALYTDSPNHKLGTVAEYLALEYDSSRLHTALADIELTIALARRMLEDTGRSMYELFELANTPVAINVMPFGKHKGMPLNKLPQNYVDWLLTKCTGLDANLRHSLLVNRI